MTCYHPNRMFIVGTDERGKKITKFASYGARAIELLPNGSYLPTYDFAPSHTCVCNFTESFPVPCGQCIGCRLDYSRQWANRMMMELPYHANAYFLTLTYSPEHVPVNLSTNALTLKKKDLQDFFKRLRRRLDYLGLDSQITYYAAGEYGDSTFRPHYHAILYCECIPDIEYFSRSSSGEFAYYTSDLLTDAWSKGHVLIANVTWNSCAYVSRYVMKKVKGKDSKEHYEKAGLEPEFAVMSLKPAIGKRYYDEHSEEIYKYDSITLSTPEGGITFKPPHYFDTIYATENPDRMIEIKLARQADAESALNERRIYTDLTDLEYMSVQEYDKKQSISALQRGKI